MIKLLLMQMKNVIYARSAQLHLVWPALRKRGHCSNRDRTKNCDFGGFCMLDFMFYIFDRFALKWIIFTRHNVSSCQIP